MKYYVDVDQREFGLEILHTQDGTVVRPVQDDDAGECTSVDFAVVHADVVSGEGLYSLIADGKSYQLYLEAIDHGFRLAVGRARYGLTVLTEREWRLKKAAPRQTAHSGEMTVSAPMPGLVKSVLVAAGDIVSRGQRLVVLEAMKMENDIGSPADGKVSRVHVEAGEVVEGGKPLMVIEA